MAQYSSIDLVADPESAKPFDAAETNQASRATAISLCDVNMLGGCYMDDLVEQICPASRNLHWWWERLCTASGRRIGK